MSFSNRLPRSPAARCWVECPACRPGRRCSASRSAPCRSSTRAPSRARLAAARWPRSTRCLSRPSPTAAASPDASCRTSRCRITARQEYDTSTFHGGNYATPHPQYYRNTALAPEKAPDHGGYDVLADVIPKAHRRGMKVIAWFEDVIGRERSRAGFDQAREVVLSGPASTSPARAIPTRGTSGSGSSRTTCGPTTSTA